MLPRSDQNCKQFGAIMLALPKSDAACEKAQDDSVERADAVDIAIVGNGGGFAIDGH